MSYLYSWRKEDMVETWYAKTVSDGKVTEMPLG